LIFIAFIFGAMSLATAQKSAFKTLKGIISDAESQDYLVGVHIFARVAHVGTVSDQKGVFQMRVHPNDTLIITTVGYTRQVVPLAYFREPQIDLFIQMDPEVIELPGITIIGEQDVSYLHRNSPNPYKIHSFKPYAEHPDLDVPAGSLDYGPLSRWGKEAKEKRKLLKVYQHTSQDRIYVQTVSSDSVRNVFTNMYGISENEYNNFVIFLNTYNPRMDRRNKNDIIRVMHETFLRFKPEEE
jgi:hypothetical protein